jgi:transcriptional regulator with XRE-family HTH domain
MKFCSELRTLLIFNTVCVNVKKKVRNRDTIIAQKKLPNPLMSILSEKLRALRKAKGLTLDKLAEKSGLSKSYIWELENRESQRPSAEKLTALADVLGVTVSYFIEEDVREPEEKHRDEAFFRNYQKLDTESKEHLRKILETFKKG